MRFIPRRGKPDASVPKRHPLKELSWLVGGVILMFVALYALLGWAVDWVVPRIPVSVSSLSSLSMVRRRP